MIRVRRDPQNLVPKPDMMLQAGDQVVILAAPAAREELARRGVLPAPVNPAGQQRLRRAYQRVRGR